MSFFVLLLILSLLLVIPAFFIITAKRQAKNSQIAGTTSSQAFISQPPPSPKIEVTALPNLFQQMLRDIEAQYAELVQTSSSDNITNPALFTAKKLFYTRLPEILADYLALEPHYAKTHIVIVHNQMTSFDIVFEQLRSILNFMYQANHRGQTQIVQNLMTNQRYLQTVLSDTGLSSPQAADTSDTALAMSYETLAFDCDQAAGQQYLANYLPAKHQPFSDNLISRVGRLVYFISLTQSAIFESLGDALDKLHIRADLKMEALEKLAAYQLPIALQKLVNLPSEQLLAHEEALASTLQSLTQLLEAMLDTLDKPLSVPDKLALLQNLHDDFGQLADRHFLR